MGGGVSEKRATKKPGDAGFLTIVVADNPVYSKPVVNATHHLTRSRAQSHRRKIMHGVERDGVDHPVRVFTTQMLTEDMFGLLDVDDQGRFVPYDWRDSYEPRHGDVLLCRENDSEGVARYQQWNETGFGCWTVDGSDLTFSTEEILPDAVEILYRRPR